MTEKEIEERLQALPYDVPSDIRPSAVSILMTAAGAEGPEAEEKFWEHLRHLSPSEQGRVFCLRPRNARGEQVCRHLDHHRHPHHCRLMVAVLSGRRVTVAPSAPLRPQMPLSDQAWTASMVFLLSPEASVPHAGETQVFCAPKVPLMWPFDTLLHESEHF